MSGRYTAGTFMTIFSSTENKPVVRCKMHQKPKQPLQNAFKSLEIHQESTALTLSKCSNLTIKSILKIKADYKPVLT